MDGLHQVAAAQTVIELDGKSYRLSPLKAKHYAEIERHILQSRPDPLEAVKSRLEGLPEHLQRHLVGLAYDQLLRGPRVAADELWQWMNSREGACYALWLAVREQHPEVTLEECRRLVEAADQEVFDTIQRRLDEASGLPPGKQAGQAYTEQKRAAETAPSPGGASSAN
jgi:hypothetical protein